MYIIAVILHALVFPRCKTGIEHLLTDAHFCGELRMSVTNYTLTKEMRTRNDTADMRNDTADTVLNETTCH